MRSPLISGSSRLRRTPYSKRVEEAGVKSYTVYNHMLLATAFDSLEEDCKHLKKAVQVWDVSVQRQVEITGSDSLRLLQMTTPRDLNRMTDDQCYYIPMVDEKGFMINDPVAVKLKEDRYWISIADSDMLFYFKGLASGMKLDVEIFEPDVNILSIQGPKSVELIKRMFGDKIAETKFFKHKKVNIFDKEMIIARSGWSHQSCFEIYVEGSKYGEALWDKLFKVGKDLDVRAGCPNLIERIESGLLSFGNDITPEHTPFEAGLGKFLSSGINPECLAYENLKKNDSPKRIIKPIKIEGSPIEPITYWVEILDENNEFSGYISSAAWSSEFNTNVAIGMVNRKYWNIGSKLKIILSDESTRNITVEENFWS